MENELIEALQKLTNVVGFQTIVIAIIGSLITWAIISEGKKP